MTIAEITLWNKKIAAVEWNEEQEIGYFEYTPSFLTSGIEPSPLTMPLANTIYSFPSLAKPSFYGLPGLLADALPDKYGHALINAWLEKHGRAANSLNPVERLCYIGSRAMGALEFHPAIGKEYTHSHPIELPHLVTLASEVLSKKTKIHGTLTKETLKDVIRVGTSAGGARAKAVIAWNPETNELRSGQVKAPAGFEYWLLKFDGVSGNKDKEAEDPKGYGLIEYAYYRMACEAGIIMSPSHLLQENGRFHFMTKRFDRKDDGSKYHMQSLAALAHYDFNQAGGHSYEQALRVIRSLALSMDDLEQQFRRMTFNIIARNQDDHVKNIAFLMDKSGKWSLSPAFDVTYSYNPQGMWTATHQMSLNSKRDQFTLNDFLTCADNASIQKQRAKAIIEEVEEAVEKWKTIAAEVGIEKILTQQIAKTHRKIL